MKKKTAKKSPKKPAPKSTKTASRPATMGEAAVTIVRAWLSDSDFREDPTGKDPERIQIIGSGRIQIIGSGYEGVRQEHYVDVRVYVEEATIQAEIESPS